MRKMLSLAVLFAMLVSCLSGIGAIAAEEGTQGNPYLIASKADLDKIASAPSAFFRPRTLRKR